VKAVTRKLRRRPNEPAPIPNEKRRKPSPTQLSFVLTDEEILDDLKVTNKGIHSGAVISKGVGRKISRGSNDKKKRTIAKNDQKIALFSLFQKGRTTERKTEK